MKLQRLLAALAALFTLSASAQTRQLTVPTEVEFDASGQALSLRFTDEKAYSAGFMEGLRERVMRIRIPPQQWQQQPAKLRSGLMLRVEIDEDPTKAQVRLADIVLMPLLLKQDFAPIPLLHADFDKTYLVQCEIDAEGACQVTGIETEGPVEEPARRWVLSTMKLWRFQPPTLNGHPIPSQLAVPLRLLGTPTAEQAPPDFRRRGS